MNKKEKPTIVWRAKIGDRLCQLEVSPLDWDTFGQFVNLHRYQWDHYGVRFFVGRKRISLRLWPYLVSRIITGTGSIAPLLWARDTLEQWLLQHPQKTVYLWGSDRRRHHAYERALLKRPMWRHDDCELLYRADDVIVGKALYLK